MAHRHYEATTQHYPSSHTVHEHGGVQNAPCTAPRALEDAPLWRNAHPFIREVGTRSACNSGLLHSKDLIPRLMMVVAADNPCQGGRFA